MRTGTLMLVACFALVACGPGVVAPSGDDDTTIPGGDDDTGDDDSDHEDPGGGMLSVTLQSLAIELDATAVTAEIILDGVPTGTMAPATIALDAGSHEITVRRDGFVSPTEEITVERDGTATVQCMLGRDLTGEWLVHSTRYPQFHPRPITISMGFVRDPWGETPWPEVAEPCPVPIYAVINGPGAVCLLPEDALGIDRGDYDPDGDGEAEPDLAGAILNEGTLMHIGEAWQSPSEWEEIYEKIEE
ncbi:MAG: PEGA domain-containing protein [bacterium]|nr:PEGA domain-containing protein [bacterium]